MFTDGRSKKVVFIAHCILNQNSISDGTAVFPAAFKEVIKNFLMLILALSKCHVLNFAVWGLIEEMTMEQMFLLSLKIPVFVRKCKKVKLINC